jgi:16S rRNA (uracil1498-N3)-methyltransferase
MQRRDMNSSHIIAPPCTTRRRFAATVPVPRFHCSFSLAHAVQVRLPPSAAHHAAKVLRLRAGDDITLFDGSGGEYQASINTVERDAVLVDVGRHVAVEREAPFPICLAQGLSSGDKMDYTLQMAVQMGIARFQPLATRKSVVRLTEERGARRQQHWESVAVHACEQCGRNRLPEVGPVTELSEWLVTAGEAGDTRLLLSPEAKISLADLPRPHDELIMLVGPEAGLADDELAAAQAAGFQQVRLGPRILRTEVAGLAALAAMNALWGDF